jgi:hypothetical protein
MAKNNEKTKKQKDEKLTGKQLSKVTGGVMGGSGVTTRIGGESMGASSISLVPDNPPDGNEPYL